MRYFRLYDFLSPEGDLYRFDGTELELSTGEDEWAFQHTFSASGQYETPEEWFSILLLKQLLFGAPLGHFEEVSAP